MSQISYKDHSYNNWKEFFGNKFSNRDLFVIVEESNGFILTWRVTSTNKNCLTEIVIKFLVDTQFTEMFDIVFNHPDSPSLTKDNKTDKYGFDGMGSSFSLENLIHLEDWIEIPLYKGWIETSYYFNNKLVKTDATWIQKGKQVTIPISQEHLNNYGCLSLPIFPFVYVFHNLWWRINPSKFKKKENIIPPMYLNNLPAA